MSTRARAWVLGSVFGGAALAGACSRPGRGRAAGAPEARPDTAARATADSAPRADSARADSARQLAADAARRDSAARDTAPRVAARPRRREVDPASRCRVVDFNGSPPTSRLQSLTDPTGKYITFVGGGVVARCVGVNNTLRADSAEYYETAGFLVLVGNVAYDEPRRVAMTSQRLTYYVNEERLLAEQNVVVTLPTGSTMTGPTAEYLRVARGIRERSRLTATGRPVLRVVDPAPAPRPGQAAGAARPKPDTATVIANTIVDEGDSLVFASGSVQLIRPDVTANSDSATLDQGIESARLVRNAVIRGTQGRPFTLSGTVIDLFSRERSLTRVLSRDSARIVSQDLNLRSDTVDLRLAEGRVERAFAWGPSRATATSTDRDVVADSIDALLPGQRIRELRALRRAVARSAPDTVRIRSTERDELRGDTILARFDSAAAERDTTRNPPVRQIVAAGNASSLYQLASGGGRTAPPAINYVRGRLITVDFDSNQVQTVTVVDSAEGVYLEPSADSTPDSAATRRPRAPTRQPAPRRPGLPGAGRRPGGVTSQRPATPPQDDHPAGARTRPTVAALVPRPRLSARPPGAGAGGDAA